MNPPTTKHQQLILLDHDMAKAVDALAAERRVSKQSVLREAVHTLLVIEGKIPSLFATRINQIRQSLLMAEHDLYEVFKRKASGDDALAACTTALVKVTDALDQLGEPKRKRSCVLAIERRPPVFEHRRAANHNSARGLQEFCHSSAVARHSRGSTP
jgi:hypothetical protein